MGPFFGGIVTLVVIIVGLIQTLAPILKSISEANEKARRKAMANSGRVRGRDTVDPDSFLPDLTQQGVSRPAGSTGSKEPAGAARRQSARSKKQKGAGADKSNRKPVQAAQSRGSASGVGAHVDAYIGQHVKSHIGQQIGDAVKNDISDQVRSHLGEDKNKPAAPTAATTHGSVAAGNLLLALRSPQGVKQAIMISEVLAKPKSLRRS